MTVARVINLVDDRPSRASLSNDPARRAEVALHPSASRAVLRYLANDPDPEVRAAVARVVRERAVRNRLLLDPDPRVRIAAVSNTRHR